VRHQIRDASRCWCCWRLKERSPSGEETSLVYWKSTSASVEQTSLDRPLYEDTLPLYMILSFCSEGIVRSFSKKIDFISRSSLASRFSHCEKEPKIVPCAGCQSFTTFGTLNLMKPIKEIFTALMIKMPSIPCNSFEMNVTFTFRAAQSYA